MVGIFEGENKATNVVEDLIDKGFHADRISLLRKGGVGSGDDMLGLTYSNNRQRIKVWAKFGLILGGVWGSFTSMASMYILYLMGELMLGSFIFDIMKAAAISAILGGIAMAIAAVLMEITSTAHESGIPKEELDSIHRNIEEGRFIVILHCARNQVEDYTRHIKWSGADPVLVLPIYY